MPMLDAINRLGFTKLIDVRHEQAGTHAADGYARATGEIGVMIASTGPGTTNTVTGLYEAAYASSRVLVITGQAETGFYGRGLGYVHEADKQMAMLRSVVAPRKVRARRATSRRCWRTSLRRCRAAAVNRARSRFRSICSMPTSATSRSRLRPSSRTHPTRRRSTAAVELLKTARRRVIIAGGGVIAAGAGAALRRIGASGSARRSSRP